MGHALFYSAEFGKCSRLFTVGRQYANFAQYAFDYYDVEYLHFAGDLNTVMNSVLFVF